VKEESMCLESIQEKLTRPKKMKFYKVFEFGTKKVYYGECRCRKTQRKIGHIYREKSKKEIEACSGKRYRRGFHGFITLKAAKKWSGNGTFTFSDKIILCEGMVRTIGKQCGSKTVVADTMELIREVKVKVKVRDYWSQLA